ncbi:MAG: hypothetical protein EOP48_02400 [Sphingobacteriales bacterium]|nr:MAG: hypothetical protein EOP48_02400 [Sphingobacteriales bacterium]
MLIYQHEGVLEGTPTRIGNANDVSAQLKGYFSLLKSTNADLGVTPEYTCPLSVLEAIVEDTEKWPNAHKLWVIGLESIPKQDIVGLTANFNTDSVHAYFDPRVVDFDNTFLDPIVYVFRAEVAKVDKLVVLFQFKSHHMGARGPTAMERDHMVKGRQIYVLRNNPDSVFLMTLICSEAMNFKDELTPANRTLLSWANTPYLLLNPQANPEPIYPSFVEFRTSVFRTERKEIVSVNWNNCSKIGEKIMHPEKWSRSGIYMRSSDVEPNNLVRLRANHKLGMYYFFYARDRHAFLLNSQGHAYLISNLSVHIAEGVLNQQNRNGPEVRSAYLFGELGQLVPVDHLSDEHIAYLESLDCAGPYIMDPTKCVFEKETLACLSTANVDAKSGLTWYQVNRLKSVRLSETDEINKRLTIAQDGEKESVNSRNNYLDRMEILNSEILPNKALLPATLSNLREKQLILGYSDQSEGGSRLIEKQAFRYNLTTPEDELIYATVAYIGMASDGEASRKFTELQSLFIDGNKNRERIVIYYRKGTTFYAKDAGDSGRFGNTNLHANDSYLK